jgi:hypothetical protein
MRTAKAGDERMFDVSGEISKQIVGAQTKLVFDPRALLKVML